MSVKTRSKWTAPIIIAICVGLMALWALFIGFSVYAFCLAADALGLSLIWRIVLITVSVIVLLAVAIAAYACCVVGAKEDFEDIWADEDNF